MRRPTEGSLKQSREKYELYPWKNTRKKHTLNVQTDMARGPTHDVDAINHGIVLQALQPVQCGRQIEIDRVQCDLRYLD